MEVSPIFFSVSTSFVDMTHSFCFEDVIKNFVKVIKALRFIAVELITGDVCELVSVWLPLTNLQRISFIEMAFGEFHPGFDIPESSQDDFRQVGSTDFYYW
jgi:hypothetical protein